MIPQKKSTISLVALIFAVAILLDHSVALSGPAKLPGPGTVIPAFSIPVPVSDADKAYLKIVGGDEFQPGNIAAETLLIEIFSVFCAACQFQLPYMNELYSKIEKDPELKGRAKMVGIGVGNNKWDIAYHKDSYKFPIIADEDLEVHALVGAPATPFLIFARPYGHGRLLVVDSHLGTLKDSDKLLSMVRKAYKADISKIKVAPE